MKNLKILFLLFTLLNVLFSQQCDLQDPQKLDCGFMGIDQSKCEAKGCCWKPAFDFK